MPKMNFALLLVCVIAFAAVTVWLFGAGNTGGVALAVPAALIVALLIRRIGR